MSGWMSIPIKKINTANPAKNTQPEALLLRRLIEIVKTIKSARPAPKGKPFRLV